MTTGLENQCPIPTIPRSAPSSRSTPHRIFRSRICPMACSRQRHCRRRASASRSATMCSISGNSSRIAGWMSATSACSRRRRSIRSWRWGRRSGRAPGRGSANCCVTTIRELRDNDGLRAARAGADGAGKAASADRGRRLHRFLFVEGARHQCRRHVPRQGQCACSRTGCICRSATTAVRRPSWSPAPRCAGRAAS